MLVTIKTDKKSCKEFDSLQGAKMFALLRHMAYVSNDINHTIDVIDNATGEVLVHHTYKTA